MPVPPKFNFIGQLPFFLKWHANANIWQLDMPEDFGCRDLPAMAVFNPDPSRISFMFGQGSLGEVTRRLQGRLDLQDATGLEAIEGLPEYTFNRVDERRIDVTGPRIDYVMEALGMSRRLVRPQSASIVGAKPMKRYVANRAYFQKMAETRQAKAKSFQDLFVVETSDKPVGHTLYSGVLAKEVRNALAAEGIPHAWPTYGVIAIGNWHLGDVERITCGIIEFRNRSMALLKERLASENVSKPFPKRAKLKAGFDGVTLSIKRSQIDDDAINFLYHLGFDKCPPRSKREEASDVTACLRYQDDIDGMIAVLRSAVDELFGDAE